MNLRDLEYIAAIAAFGSFARAAEACHVSSSTLSIQLGKLEAYLGVMLFERTNKRVALTPTGRAVIAIAQDILRQSQRLRDVAKEGQDPFGGQFKLGAFPTLAPYYLPKIIPEIVEAFPQLKLRLYEEKTPKLLEMLKRHELDAALLSLPITDTDLNSAHLFDDPFYLACTQSHRLSKRKAIQMGDLQGETLMLLEDGHCLRDQALDVCHKTNANEDLEFRATSLETLRQMVVADAGITLVPSLARLPGPNLIYVPFTKKDCPVRHIGLVWRRSTTRLKIIETMTDVLRNKSSLTA